MNDPKIDEKIALLAEKYSATGQDLNAYLEGLYYSNYLDYWDYAQLDILLSLQKTRTNFPDEKIFVTYHQITELYFNLILHEIEQISMNASLNAQEFIMRLKRINNYFNHTVHSFDIMIDGMDREQFLKFRMALLPASGFQSAQYRMIEIACCDVIQLVAVANREAAASLSIPEQLQLIYWRKGATELKTGNKTFTLRRFEEKYDKQFTDLAMRYADCNLWQKYLSLPEADRNNPDLITALRQLDLHANVNWPIVHMRSAARYLHRDPEDIAATGGTNWQKYLPPVNQRLSFFPALFTADEILNWGKTLTWDNKQ